MSLTSNPELYQANGVPAQLPATATPEPAPCQPQSWWDRLLRRKPVPEVWTDWQFVRVLPVKQTLTTYGGIFGSSGYQEWDAHGALYRRTHRTNGSRRYSVIVSSVRWEIDPQALETSGHIVTL